MSQSALQQSIAAVAQAPGQFIQSAKANGLMKRNSIFSRPESRNGSIDLDTPNMESSWPSIRFQSAQPNDPRPSTSTGVMERSNTDPTIAKRHSLFRSRRKGPRKSAGDEDVSGEESSPQNFKSQDEYYTHLKKQSISQPFNFQHLSHTRRKHVPDLATVDEKGLPRVPSNGMTQAPRSHPQGVRLDSNGIPRGFINSRPTTPCLPESGPTGPQHAGSRSVDVTQSMQTMPAVVRRPRATSCQTRNVLQRNSLSLSQPASTDNQSATETTPPPQAQVQHCSPSEVQYRSQQPLPALPQRDGSKRNSRRMTQDSQLSYTTLGGESSSTTSPRSSQSIRAINAGPWGIRDSTAGLSLASSWEDDVDFCYKQEAESTCDFNWDEMDQDVGGFRLSRFLPPGDGSRASALFALAPPSTSPPQRQRSSIVGHRGFQHARTTSVIHEASEKSAQNSQAQLEAISGESEPMFGPEMMNLDASVESISDGASAHTGSSGHKKSNSCASCESGVCPAPTGSDNGHSSIASLNSIPELIHSTTAGSSTDAIVAQEPLNAISQEEQHRLMCDIIRKPSTLSNRAILQAGRVVQRQRPSNAGRLSRISSAQAQRPLAVGEEETTWI
ncbi:hypothetical protein Q7P37_004963 [Cladosporium fusiforme]